LRQFATLYLKQLGEDRHDSSKADAGVTGSQILAGVLHTMLLMLWLVDNSTDQL